MLEIVKDILAIVGLGAVLILFLWWGFYALNLSDDYNESHKK